MEQYDVVVVGAGIAGLTAASYVARENKSTLLIEKESYVGGMVGSFNYKGFSFERGARGMESSGIIFPMLKELGIELPTVHKPIQIEIEDQSVTIESTENLDDYELMLVSLFPEETNAISLIIRDIKKVMGYMDVLYGIDNPLFLQKPVPVSYLLGTLLPWSFRFLKNVRKAMKLMDPVEKHLNLYTNNQSLIDMIKQHFFAGTPTFFALSYFTLYLDYQYPKQGMQQLPNLLFETYQKLGGHTFLEQSVTSIDFQNNILNIGEKQVGFKHLIWAADLKLFYNTVQIDTLTEMERAFVLEKQTLFKQSKGAESIWSLYVAVDKNVKEFQAKGPHSFITLNKRGLSSIPPVPRELDGSLSQDQEKLTYWLRDYFTYNTFEISVPNLRNETLAPKNQTGLMISTLFDYSLTKEFKANGLYDWFKETTEAIVLSLFDDYVYPGLIKDKIDSFVATPLTIETYTNATEGSVSGWSFENKPFPVIYQFLQVSKSVQTEFKQASIAGQWVFNPAGIPVAAMTGKLAANRAIKQLKIDF